MNTFINLTNWRKIILKIIIMRLKKYQNKNINQLKMIQYLKKSIDPLVNR